MKRTSGPVAFLISVVIAVVLAVWSRVGGPQSVVVWVAVAAIVALLAIAEWRR